MSPYLEKYLPVVKQYAMRAVAYKLSEESLADKQKRKIVLDVTGKDFLAPIEFSKSKLIMTSVGYLVIAILTALAATGKISPEILEMVKALVLTG